MTALTDAEKDRKICNFLGTCAHDGGVWVENTEWFCEKCGRKVDPEHPQIDFTRDPLALLRLLDKKDLLAKMNLAYYPPTHGFIEPDSLLISVRLLTVPAALRDAVWEWGPGRETWPASDARPSVASSTDGLTMNCRG